MEDENAGPLRRERRAFARLIERARARPLRAAFGSLAAGAGLQLTVAASGVMAARLLGVTERGELALLWAVAVVVGQLGTGGLHAAFAYAVASGESPANVAGRMRGVIAVQLLVAPVLVAAGAALALGVGRSGLLIAEVSTVLVPSAFILLLYGLAFAQGRQRYRVVQMHRLVQPLLYVLALAAVAAVGAGSLAVVTSAWSATLIAAGLFAWRQGLGRWWPPRPAAAAKVLPERRDVMRFGFNSTFSAFGFVEHLMLDLLMVGLIVSPSQFGLYVAGTAFANLPRFLGQSIGYIAYPEVAKVPPRERGRLVRRYLLLAVVTITPVAVALIAAVGWLLPFLFGSEFEAAVPVAQILLVATLLQALRRVGAEAVRGFGRGRAATGAEIVFAIVFVAAVFPLASDNGAEGAATAAAIAALAGALALAVLERRTGLGGEAGTGARPDAREAALVAQESEPTAV